MKLIIFGKFSFNHIYFLFYALFTLIRSIFSDLLFEGAKHDSQYFYSIYLVTLSRFISIIPLLINKKLSKRKKSKEKEQNDNNSSKKINYIYNDEKKILKKQTFISTLKVAIFEFLAEFIICLFHFLNDKPEVVSYYSLQLNLIFNTVTQYFVSHFVLNYTFYSHHYLSFGINIFCTLIFLIIDIIEIVNREISEFQFYIYIFMRIIRLFLFALGDNYAKIALYKYFLSPFSLLLFMAIEETMFLIIVSIPLFFIKLNDNNEIVFANFSDYLTGINLLYTIIVFLCNFFYEMFLLIIVDRFSPSHLPLGFILHFFLNNIYNIIKNLINDKKIEYFLYANFFIYIILFIAAMIHNEIFIINKFGFNTNTKKFLDDKMEKEKKEDEILPADEEYYSYESQVTKKGDKLIPLIDVPSKG